MLKRLNSLWIGDRLGYIEQLCLVSALAAGHSFTLYSYAPDKLKGVPRGIDLRDAREVMSDPNRVKYFHTKWAALGSDFFRYALLEKNLGCWVDMDICFLKPFDFTSDYIFGWESTLSINGAVLHLPAGSGILRDLWELPKATNWRPPFFGPRRTLRYYWKRLREGAIGLEDLPWGSIGPALITYLVKKHRLTQFAQERCVFYPVKYQNAQAFFGPSEAVEQMIKPETRAVHMWHSQLGDRIKKAPPRDSFLDVVCRRHGIETSGEG